jgi:serine/threonine protein kinase
MLTPWGRLYLIDFGIARRYQEGQLRDTGPLGSPGYAAPEQYGRMQTTISTDVYGLGATLQTLLTGKEPLDIRLQGMPSEVRIPWKLQALLNCMMDRNPFKRPGSIEIKRTLTPYVTSSLSFMSMLTFGFMSMLQSGFIVSSFVGTYLLLALAFMIGFCISALLRSCRAAPTRLSAKAATMIIGKQLFPSLILVSTLTPGISLLYAFLARPQLSGGNWSLLWLWGISPILIAFAFFIAWLKLTPAGAGAASRQSAPQYREAGAQTRPAPPLASPGSGADHTA